MKNKTNIVIVSAVRTPVGKYMGGLKDMEAYKLGAVVLDESITALLA